MTRHRFLYASILGVMLGGLITVILAVSSYPFDQFVPNTALRVHTTKASGSSEFGVVGAVPSLSSDASKQAAIDKITGAGFGWMRHEFTYANPVDFSGYDAANTKAKAAGIKTLGLLAYPGSGKTHDDWKSFVSTVVSHFGTDISAWEIMNEADTYLSPADYVGYLNEARAIIKANNSGATIVASGITSRQEATNFWDGIAAAGGWGSFDVIGLHVYHSGNPEKVNFGGGDLVGELDRVVGDINKNGGGKPIWITEMGYQSGAVGTDNQANWLARSLIMLKSVAQVERTFIYHLYDGGGDSYGLLDSGLSAKPAYSKVASAVAALTGKGTQSKLTPQQRTILDDFSSLTMWKTDATSNGTTTLSLDQHGYSGSAMSISYNFTADSAYAVAEKSIPISGTPSAISAWIYGDDTKNVWKFRFIDAKGETFQTDLGSIPSGWHYEQFTLGSDTAFTSWGGDGKIDFPISFNSVVIDHQGGATSASGKVDELAAVTGSADLYAYTAQGAVAFWKGSGSDSATLCGASRQFREDPQYASGVDCSDTPKPTTASPSTSPTSSGSSSSRVTSTLSPKTKATPPPPRAVVDKTKSYIRLDGKDVVADDKQTFRMVVGLRDASGNPITDRKPGFLVSGGPTTMHDSILVGPEWMTEISSNAAGQRSVVVKGDDQELGTLTMTFVAAPQPTQVTSTISQPTPLVVAVPPSPPLSTHGAEAVGGVSILVLLGLAIKFRVMLLALFHRKII